MQLLFAMVVGLFGCEPGNPKHTVEVQVHLEPPLETPGANVFLTGFDQVDPHTGHPPPGSSPAAHHTLGMFVYKWPLVTRVELVKGLHYFAMVGFQPWPAPGDHMSKALKITSETDSPLRILVGGGTLPAEPQGETP